jgi:hypothetical protein
MHRGGMKRNRPDAKYAVACSGEALRMANDFSAAFGDQLNRTTNTKELVGLTHLADLWMLPLGFTGQRLGKAKQVQSVPETKCEEMGWIPATPSREMPKSSLERRLVSWPNVSKFKELIFAERRAIIIELEFQTSNNRSRRIYDPNFFQVINAFSQTVTSAPVPTGRPQWMNQFQLVCNIFRKH